MSVAKFGRDAADVRLMGLTRNCSAAEAMPLTSECCRPTPGGHPPIAGRHERERCARKRSEAKRVGCATDFELIPTCRKSGGQNFAEVSPSFISTAEERSAPNAHWAGRQ